MTPKLPLRLAGVLMLLSFPFVSYCCDQFTSNTAKPVTGNCGAIFSFTYVECNSSGIYYIQYSPDNVNYYIIGTVTPNGSGSYSYTDNYAHSPTGSNTVEYRAIYYIAGVETVYSGVASVTLGSATCSNNNITRCYGLPTLGINASHYGVCAGSSTSYTVTGNPPYPVTWLATAGTLTQTWTGATVTNSTYSNYSYFTLTASSEGCDTYSEQVPLGIAPGPTTMSLADGTTVKAGSDYDIYSAPVNNWSVTNGTILYGQGTNDLGVQVANLNGNTMTVIATVVDFCGTSPELIYQYPISSSGGGGGGGTRFMSDSAGSLNTGFGAGIKLGVYPNPVTNSVQVVISSTDYTKSYIKLFDLNGHLLKMIVPSGQTTLVDMTQQPKGIYMMEIFDGKQRTTQKIVRL
jgi:hypothetical protein